MGYNGNLNSRASEVITTQGDLRRGDSSGNPERLAVGSANQVLQSNGTTESWATLSTGDTVLTTQGDILYENASGLQRLGAGTSGYFLKTLGTSANPIWASSGGVTLTHHNVTENTSYSTTSTSYVDVPSMDATMTGTGAGHCIATYTTTTESSGDWNMTCLWSTDGEIPPSPNHDSSTGGIVVTITSISLTLGSQTSKWQMSTQYGTLEVCRSNTYAYSQWLEIS